VQIRAAYDHLPAIFALEAFRQSWSWSDNVGVLQAKTINPLVKALIEQQGFVLAAMTVLVTT
jgi:hypothetical protein